MLPATSPGIAKIASEEIGNYAQDMKQRWMYYETSRRRRDRYEYRFNLFVPNFLRNSRLHFSRHFAKSINTQHNLIINCVP